MNARAQLRSGTQSWEGMATGGVGIAGPIVAVGRWRDGWTE